MPDPDQPGGSHDPTRAQDPVDPTRAQDPVDPTRVQPGVDATRVGGAGYARPEPRPPLEDRPTRRPPHDDGNRTATWLWALLAAILVAIVLFALFGQGDDDDDAVGTADTTVTDPGAVETAPEDTAADTTVETAPAETTTTEDSADTTAPPAEDDPTDGGDQEAGTVTTADGTDLLALLEGDDGDAERLAPYAGETVSGTGVEVLEIVDGEGFWIGTGDDQRIFAHATGEGAEVEVGQRIDFDGVLTPNPAEGADGAHDVSDDRYGQQGHHLELGSITPT